MSFSAVDVQGLMHDCFDFLSTDEPTELQPAAGGDPITFMHGLRSGDVDATENSPRVPMEMIAWTKEPLCMAGVYTYNGESWTAGEDNHHKAGNPLMTFSYLMTRQVKRP